MRGNLDKLIALVAVCIPILVITVGLPRLAAIATAAPTGGHGPLSAAALDQPIKAVPPAQPSQLGPPPPLTPPPTLQGQTGGWMPPSAPTQAGAAPAAAPAQAASAATPAPAASPSPAPSPSPSPAASPTADATTPAGFRSYTVQHGDELKQIAARYGVSIQAIEANNSIPNPDSLRVGQTLRIPPAG